MAKMRRLLFFATFIIGRMTVAQAQDIYYAKAAAEGKWNKYTEKWVWGPEYEVDLRFFVQSNTIIVNDEARSTYRLGKKTVDEDNYRIKQTGWNAVDERDRKCVVKVLFRKSDKSREIYVLYADLAFVYYLTD